MIVQELIENLSSAFGGDSQIPDRVFGQAIFGHLNNNGLEMSEAIQAIIDVVAHLAQRWSLDEVDEAKALSEISGGFLYSWGRAYGAIEEPDELHTIRQWRNRSTVWSGGGY